MSWIEEIAVDDASGKLAETYSALIKQRGKISNILMVHSLNPEAMNSHLDLYMTIMFGKSGLSRAEREAIAVIVSANNRCAYCIHHHAEALRRYMKDEAVVASLMKLDGFDALEPRMCAILKHAQKLTRNPGDMTKSDIDALRGHDLTDSDLLDITLIVGYFNFVNRIAMGLGVDFTADELTGYTENA